MNIYHTAGDRTPFTYLLTHKITKKRYYGSRYAKKCHPCQLGREYLTSSPTIKEIIELEGKDIFIWEVRLICNSIEQARERESKFLRRVKAASSEYWYNRSNGNGNFLNTGHSEETKKKISNYNLLNNIIPPKTFKTCEHCGISINAGGYALWHGEFCLENKTPTAKERISDSTETRNLKSAAKLSHPKKLCEYCLFFVEPSLYGLAHGKYCIKNPNRQLKNPRPKTLCIYCGRMISNNRFEILHNLNCKSRKI